MSNIIWIVKYFSQQGTNEPMCCPDNAILVVIWLCSLFGQIKPRTLKGNGGTFSDDKLIVTKIILLPLYKHFVVFYYSGATLVPKLTVRVNDFPDKWVTFCWGMGTGPQTFVQILKWGPDKWGSTEYNTINTFCLQKFWNISAKSLSSLFFSILIATLMIWMGSSESDAALCN